MDFKIIVIAFLAILCTSANAQSNVFDISRSGTLEEIRAIYCSTPEAINSKNKNGHTPLILACYNGNIPVAKFLVEKVDNVDEKSDDGSALMAATVKGQLELVELLLQKNANPNLTDLNGTTALHYAVMFEQDQLVKSLVTHGAKADIRNRSNQSALDIAKIKNNEKILETLKKAVK